MWQLEIPEGAKPIGYRFLVEKYKIETPAHYRWSYAGPKWEKRKIKIDNQHLSLHFYPRSFLLEDDPFRHLEFALKHEGLNLFIIKECFTNIDQDQIVNYILNSPTGKYARKVWFLFEWLTGNRLSIDDIGRASYVLLLDPDTYYCATPRKSPRHRILNNLLGNSNFCPLIRKSAKLRSFEDLHLHDEISQLTSQFNPNLLSRAMRYLYTKETIASWEIEREKPDKTRLARFVALLEKGEKVGELSKRMLIEIQKEIVDPRFILNDYRDFQNYIGEEPALGEMIVHFIPPKPEDIADLMDGLLTCSSNMLSNNISAVITTTVFSFGFIFLHPFWDGNGRLHRFLIHYTLHKCGFSPKGIVFPVSAVMLRELTQYDNTLEYFSKPLLELINNYKINEKGEMTVDQETRDFYRFIDFTPIAEFLFWCIKQTVHTDFENELHFLNQYDSIKQSLKNIVDMPDQLIDLFIKCVRQNGGSLSQRKRLSHFHMLTDKEISNMESVIQQVTQ